ncbi:hypothetical protein PHMEG_00027343 [Phytophthora megakarya]|uniref:RxLR effector protein n=1 Tax=Phytophthora megakarya TaxID=4795 RepID=A0A225VA25_9STRA|nr:hypothetical protein PHMEG_00027343 [Phytophthora megakarya]
MALIGSIDTTSVAMGVDKANAMPSNSSLRAHKLVKITNRDIVERSLTQKKKTLGDDHALNEERAKIMANPEAKEKVFHYLNRQKVNAQKAYPDAGMTVWVSQT